MILQLKIFVRHHGKFIKDIKKVQCTETPSVRVAVDVSFKKEFNLIATANHTETPDKGHYTPYVKVPNSSSWKFSNDTAVLKSTVEKVNNT